MVSYIEEKFQMTSPEKVHNRFTPQNSCILLGRVSTISLKFQILGVFGISFFFVNMGLYEVKSCKLHHLWKYTLDSLPEIHVQSYAGCLPKLLKYLSVKCWILNFWIFFFCSLAISFVLGHITRKSIGNYKMCNIFKMAGWRAKKWTNFGPRGWGST